MGGPAYHHVRKAQHLHLTMGGTHLATMSDWIDTYIRPWEAWPATMSKGLMDSSLPLGRDLDLENTKILLEVIKLHSR